MYLTKYEKKDTFDWDTFFRMDRVSSGIQQQVFESIVLNCRKHLKDNLLQFSVEFNRMIKELIKNLFDNDIDVLELGAGTGFLTRCLLTNYEGRGMLVDSNQIAYKRYCEMKDPIKHKITYKIADIFTYEDEKQYDIVCSFGLIEHFSDKTEIIKAHKKFLKKNGKNIIIVPMDSPLTRTYYEVFPEMNKGYRELLTEKELRNIVEENGLEIIRISKSTNQSYDFIAVVCEPNKYIFI